MKCEQMWKPLSKTTPEILDFCVHELCIIENNVLKPVRGAHSPYLLLTYFNSAGKANAVVVDLEQKQYALILNPYPDWILYDSAAARRHSYERVIGAPTPPSWELVERVIANIVKEAGIV
jgi:hypothetical protein